MRPLGLYSTDTQQALALLNVCRAPDGWSAEKWSACLVQGMAARMSPWVVRLDSMLTVASNARSSRYAAPRSTRRVRARDGDLAYGMPETTGHAWENWPQIASAAWASHLAQGRGLTIVDTRKTYPVPTGLGHDQLPAGGPGDCGR